MWYLIASLLIGILFGRLVRPNQRLRTAVSWISLASISLLLLSLGAAIGGDVEMRRGFAAMGGRALALAVAAIVGSVLMVLALRRTVLRELIPRPRKGALGDSTPGGSTEA
jgi:hypothetical protein